jgi:CheY-like chemotaxis protein
MLECTFRRRIGEIMASSRIIIADDSLTVQKVVGLVLSPRGYQVEGFNNGRLALEAIKKNSALVLIADAVMPEMNGIELGEALKKESKRISKIPFILLHSSFEKISDEDFKRSGACEKLEKPFDDKALIELVEKHTSKIDTGTASEEEEASWNMESFVKPEVPDFKNPIKTIVKHGGDRELELLEEKTQPSIMKVDLDKQADEPGIPDAHNFSPSRAKNESKTGDNDLIKFEDDEHDPEVISEDEAQSLMKDFQLKENPDGTINFDEALESLNLNADTINGLEEKIESDLIDPLPEQPEKDMGLWSQKYYMEAKQEPGSEPNIKDEEIFTSLDEDVLESLETEVPSLDNKYTNIDDKELINSITKEIVEKMVKQILPDITEKVVREEIKKIVGEDK